MASRGRGRRERPRGTGQAPPVFDQQGFVEAIGIAVAAIVLLLFRMPKLFPSVGTTKVVEHCNIAEVHRSSLQGVVF